MLGIGGAVTITRDRYIKVLDSGELMRKTSTVCSYVLMKLRPKKNCFPYASYGHLFRRPSDHEQNWEALRKEKEKRPQDLERPVTRCPYEAVGENLIWPGLN